MVRPLFFSNFILVFAAALSLRGGEPVWHDPDRPVTARLADLIGQMTLEEKARQLQNEAPAIPRLGLPAYDYWNEALHGVARAEVATVFPQAIGMAATWDPATIREEGDVIATEGRAKFNTLAAQSPRGDVKRYYGLTFWSPNINIFRDPRWGRGQETYGEDPYLTGTLAVQFIRGIQGDNPACLKAVACAKHFAVHSGPEPLRHVFDARPPRRDFHETYLPQFELAVREGRVGGVMGAYNSLYGVPACASRPLLTDLLRRQWGFDGYVVSDCGAITNIYAAHHFVPTPEAAAAAAVAAGCNLCCGKDYEALAAAVHQGLISEREIDRALARVLGIRFRLGLFDPPERVPYAHIGADQLDTPEHEKLARRLAEESLVLLKNDGVLPLDRSRIRRIAVLGWNATSVPMLVGNYNGTPAHPVTILDGIRAAVGPGIEVTFRPGCPIALRRDLRNRPPPSVARRAVEMAAAADVIIYVGGITAEYEGEEMSEANGYQGFEGGDRTAIELPAVQTQLLRALRATGKPVVFVNCSGSAMAMPWEAEHLNAILEAWYPGEQGGAAVAAALFGDANPSGRLPVTFYASTRDLPAFGDYAMANRTYRYFAGKPLYPFGHGLSYTRFEYGAASLDVSGRTLRVRVTNAGARAGDEVVQVYWRGPAGPGEPLRSLCGYARAHLAPGESREVSVPLGGWIGRYWDEPSGRYQFRHNGIKLEVGPSSGDIRRTVAWDPAA